MIKRTRLSLDEIALEFDGLFLEKSARVAGLGYALLLALQFARFLRAMVWWEAMVDQPV